MADIALGAGGMIMEFIFHRGCQVYRKLALILGACALLWPTLARGGEPPKLPVAAWRPVMHNGHFIVASPEPSNPSNADQVLVSAWETGNAISANSIAVTFGTSGAGGSTNPTNADQVLKNVWLAGGALAVSCVSGCPGTGTVTSVGLAGTANQITVTGATPITTLGSWTLSLPAAVKLGTDNSAAGTLTLANGSHAAHTIWSSAATTTNTIAGFTVVPTTGDLVTCTVVSTTCTLTDGGAIPIGNITATTPTANGVMYGEGTQALGVSGAGAADAIFMGNDAGVGSAPAFKAGPSGGTNGCAGATDTATYNTGTHAWGCHQIAPGAGTVTESGATLGYVPLWGTVPNLVNSHLNDGVTTAGTITSTEAFATAGSVAMSLIATPGAVTLSDISGSGTLLANTQYCYQSTVFNAGGQSPAHAEVCITTANDATVHSVQVTPPTSPAGSQGIEFYGRLTGAEGFIYAVASPVSTPWVDDGTSITGAAPPTRNSTADQTFLGAITIGSVAFADLPVGTVGMQIYCTNCDTPATEGVACTTGVTSNGAEAHYIRGGWVCF